MNRLVDSKIFLDGGDPVETEAATKLLNSAGFFGLDGQTTNPSLVAKNPEIAARIEAGDKLSESELLEKYKQIVQQIEQDAPGDISIEVYADKNTTADEMVKQAREFGSWIESAVIKLPTTTEGIKAAAELKSELRLNMTLCFTQEQAAAIYSATKGSAHPVFISPFVGRLDDAGLNGVDNVKNNLKMLAAGDGHVHVLAASFRRIESVVEVLRLGTQAVTINFKLFEPWAQDGFPLADENFDYANVIADLNLKPIEYLELYLEQDWQSFDIQHDLTDVGLQKFADDWNSLIKK